jgi:cytoskeleton protein RodZ
MTGGVGALLRRRREETQQDIEGVSKQLRIRSVYVRAIEEGRFQELPGTAYAVGFVRAYADYLGLDGNSIVGDYRDELARRSRQNDLVWPTEGTESRFPGGTILVVCVLLGLAIYGGWYYATQSGGTGIKLIDQVPEYIKKATGVGQTAENKPAAAESAKTEAQAATTPVPGSAPETAPATPAAQNSAASSGAVASAPATIAPPNPPAAVVLTPSTDAPAVVLGQGTTPTEPAPSGAAAAASPAPLAAPAPPAAAPQPGDQQSGDQASATQTAAVPPAAKVVIRANRDSWIEIRDKDDAVVVQEVLRQGETFNVPDKKGLVMTTGNAGGVVIELEGKPLQSLGSLGVVKRGVKLDPASLSDGSAFNTDDN